MPQPNCEQNEVYNMDPSLVQMISVILHISKMKRNIHVNKMYI
jgi:phage shock protein PspC (stress-responsive transcriptional regulator)